MMNAVEYSGVWVGISFDSVVDTFSSLSFSVTELESYSNVLSAFRAQGTLNAVKLQILKDLREAFHITDARHKAEVRRVVNDESLSTIAKMLVQILISIFSSILIVTSSITFLCN